MAVTLEQVEKLRAYSGASYTDCKEALDRSGGDMLEALLDLERQGKSATAGKGGSYTTQPGAANPPSGGSAVSAAPAVEKSGPKTRHDWEKSVEKSVRAFVDSFVNIFRHASANRLEIWRGDTLFSSAPVAALMIMAVFAFWITLLLLAVGLFLGCRYRFAGPDVGWEAVNDVLENISEAVGGLTDRVKAEFKKHTAKK